MKWSVHAGETYRPLAHAAARMLTVKTGLAITAAALLVLTIATRGTPTPTQAIVTATLAFLPWLAVQIALRMLPKTRAKHLTAAVIIIGVALILFTLIGAPKPFESIIIAAIIAAALITLHWVGHGWLTHGKITYETSPKGITRTQSYTGPSKRLAGIIHKRHTTPWKRFRKVRIDTKHGIATLQANPVQSLKVILPPNNKRATREIIRHVNL